MCFDRFLCALLGFYVTNPFYKIINIFNCFNLILLNLTWFKKKDTYFVCENEDFYLSFVVGNEPKIRFATLKREQQ